MRVSGRVSSSCSFFTASSSASGSSTASRPARKYQCSFAMPLLCPDAARRARLEIHGQGYAKASLVFIGQALPGQDTHHALPGKAVHVKLIEKVLHKELQGVSAIVRADAGGEVEGAVGFPLVQRVVGGVVHNLVLPEPGATYKTGEGL